MLNRNDDELWRVSQDDDCSSKDQKPQAEYTPSQRWWAALGALKGALLIGAAYMVGLGIIIGLMFLFW